MSGASIGRRLKMAGSQLNVSACCRSCSIDCSSGCGSPASTPGHTLALTPPADVLGLRAAEHSVGEGRSMACTSRAAGHGGQRRAAHARASHARRPVCSTVRYWRSWARVWPSEKPVAVRPAPPAVDCCKPADLPVLCAAENPNAPRAIAKGYHRQQYLAGSRPCYVFYDTRKCLSCGTPRAAPPQVRRAPQRARQGTQV